MLNNAQEKDFEKYIIKFKDWKETAGTRWEIQINETSGSLYYFGAGHLDNPIHPQFKKIAGAFKLFKPTIVFYEGQDRGGEESDTATITYRLSSSN